ncbi:FHA domain-containing protein [Aphelenchoides besseyi]|nr:FHA domain-containing protein [Aphelenchoides besseyi]
MFTIGLFSTIYRKIAKTPRDEGSQMSVAAQNAVQMIANDLGNGPPPFFNPMTANNHALLNMDSNGSIYGGRNTYSSASTTVQTNSSPASTLTSKYGGQGARSFNIFNTFGPTSTQSNGQTTRTQTNQIGPLAIFTPCSNSHPFDERRVYVSRGEDHAIKIGRAVARFQPASNNAIFDCKVLSRNHAILYYENDQFYIKDTRSSNGTFVNNYRLSNNAEESAPKPLRSGDILQLGVEIVDNTKNVASGCITCIVRLIDERGEECIGMTEENPLSARMPHGFAESVPNNCTVVNNEKLFLMSQYMKEAVFREKLLTEKLKSLESVLETTKEAAERGWKALINEERLLSRIEMLENQILCTKAMASGTGDAMMEKMKAMIEDQSKAESELREKLVANQQEIYAKTIELKHWQKQFHDLKNESKWLKEHCDGLLGQLDYERDKNKEMLAKQEANEKENENKNTVVNGNSNFSVSKVDEITTLVEIEANPFAGETEEQVVEETDSSVCLSTVTEKAQQPTVFYQEAEVQTDPFQWSSANVEVVTEEKNQKETEGLAATSSNGRSTSQRINTPGRDADYLFASMFPLAFIFGLLVIIPLRWFPDRNSNSDLSYTNTPNDEASKQSTS